MAFLREINLNKELCNMKLTAAPPPVELRTLNFEL
jgi:hypothetical protein